MREIISLNEGWTLRFPKGERAAETVTLPHTWNAVDGMDGNGSYLRTTGVYSRTFKKPVQPLAGGRVYVEVLAAALDATVKVNGTVATTHEGGFSIFRADITDLCRDGDNELTIEVSNEDTPSMYPASADFTFYGGLGLWMLSLAIPLLTDKIPDYVKHPDEAEAEEKRIAAEKAAMKAQEEMDKTETDS